MSVGQRKLRKDSQERGDADDKKHRHKFVRQRPPADPLENVSVPRAKKNRSVCGYRSAHRVYQDLHRATMLNICSRDLSRIAAIFEGEADRQRNARRDQFVRRQLQMAASAASESSGAAQGPQHLRPVMLEC